MYWIFDTFFPFGICCIDKFNPFLLIFPLFCTNTAYFICVCIMGYSYWLCYVSRCCLLNCVTMISIETTNNILLLCQYVGHYFLPAFSLPFLDMLLFLFHLPSFALCFNPTEFVCASSDSTTLIDFYMAAPEFTPLHDACYIQRHCLSSILTSINREILVSFLFHKTHNNKTILNISWQLLPSLIETADLVIAFQPKSVKLNTLNQSDLYKVILQKYLQIF